MEPIFMAKITVTTSERLELVVLTEFSFDDRELSYDLTERHPWDLNEMSGVAKVRYSVCKGHMRDLTLEEAEFMYRHGWSDGAHAQRVQIEEGDYKYDSMKEAGLDPYDVSDHFVMDLEDLRNAKHAMEASKARYEKLLLEACSPKVALVNRSSRI